MLKIQEEELHLFVRLVREHFGINLESKRNLIEGRLGSQILESGFHNFSDYLDHAFHDPTGREMTRLVDRLTTNHTYFFREEAHFDFLRRQILPELEQTVKDRDIRIWSAGCSSGEEPYSIAMTLHDHFGFARQNWDTRILATDISASILEKARAGQYPANVAQSLPPHFAGQFFRKVDEDTVEIAETVRNNVIFRSLNLIQEDFPLRSKFHVIFCRNVMIYFDQPTKLNLIRQFYELTEPGGYLMIGHTETIQRNETRWQYVQPAIYRKQK
jgi:chemotaxis protein methyltransferase CheR